MTKYGYIPMLTLVSGLFMQLRRSCHKTYESYIWRGFQLNWMAFCQYHPFGEHLYLAKSHEERGFQQN